MPCFPGEFAGKALALNQPQASIVIPTRNRQTELRQAIESALSQTIPVEILVMDDGSTDGTSEMVQQDYPMVRYFQLAKGRGPTFQRNRGIELATATVVFPIDDDAVFVSPHTVEQTLAEFDHPRIGAVGIPYINVRQDRVVRQRAPEGSGIFVTYAFIGAAHAVQRAVFLSVGGYREHFFIMGEESDLCLRMLAAGYVTRLGLTDPIHHFESPQRDYQRMDYYGRRNDILFAYHNVPITWLPLHMVTTTILGLAHAIRIRRVRSHLLGLAAGWKSVITGQVERKPIKMSFYNLFRKLKKHGPMRLTEIESKLPPMSV